jgi:hypothetical protein
MEYFGGWLMHDRPTCITHHHVIVMYILPVRCWRLDVLVRGTSPIPVRHAIEPREEIRASEVESNITTIAIRRVERIHIWRRNEGIPVIVATL